MDEGLVDSADCSGCSAAQASSTPAENLQNAPIPAAPASTRLIIFQEFRRAHAGKRANTGERVRRRWARRPVRPRYGGISFGTPLRVDLAASGTSTACGNLVYMDIREDRCVEKAE